MNFFSKSILEFFFNQTYAKDDISAKHYVGIFLGALARMHNAHVIIETGTFRGLTTLELAKQNPQAEIYTFEYDKKILKQTRWLFKIAGYKNIHLIEGNVLTELPRLCLEIGKIDFVFLDDAKENYSKNFENTLPFLSKNAIVCAHDTLFQDAKGAHFDYAKAFGKFLYQHSEFNTLELDSKDRGLTVAQRMI